MHTFFIVVNEYGLVTFFNLPQITLIGAQKEVKKYAWFTFLPLFCQKKGFF
jgi:hypothetical protein